MGSEALTSVSIKDATDQILCLAPNPFPKEGSSLEDNWCLVTCAKLQDDLTVASRLVAPVAQAAMKLSTTFLWWVYD